MSESLIIEFADGTDSADAAEFESYFAERLAEETEANVRYQSAVPRYLSEDVAVNVVIGTMKILTDIYIAKRILEQEAEVIENKYMIQNVSITNIQIVNEKGDESTEE